MIEPHTIRSIDDIPPSDAIRRLARGLPERDVMLAGPSVSAPNHRFSRLFRSVRERFQAVTGFGLASRLAALPASVAAGPTMKLGDR